MRLDDRTHLTYCTNIHPGETLDEVEQHVLPQVQAVKARVCPDAPFGVGLRLSHRAAIELASPARLAALHDMLRDSGLYVFTLNGFPYGRFHGEPVKAQVYRPDWSEPERATYTVQLAEILAQLLPDGVPGSISTVPVGFAPRLSLPLRERAAAALVEVAADLWRLAQRTGRSIALALEPEPWCVLETTDDALAYFEDHLLTRAKLAAFCRRARSSPAAAEAALRAHLGVCLDACHAAVGNEDPDASLAALQRRGLLLAKLQVSAGLEVDEVTPAHLRALEAFADDVYLHQVVVTPHGGPLRKHLDLREAIAACDPAVPQRWRIHFHVPIFTDALGPFRSTQGFLAQLLRGVRARAMTSHLEVETYTWSVLPPEHRTQPLDVAIARELVWSAEPWRA